MRRNVVKNATIVQGQWRNPRTDGKFSTAVKCAYACKYGNIDKMD